MIGGVGLTRVWVGFAVPSTEDGFTIGKSNKSFLFITHLIRASSFPIILGGGIFALAWLQEAVPFQNLLEFQIESPVNALVIGFSSGVLVGGMMYFLISITLLFIHYLYRFLDRRNSVEEFSELVDKTFYDDKENTK